MSFESRFISNALPIALSALLITSSKVQKTLVKRKLRVSRIFRATFLSPCLVLISVSLQHRGTSHKVCCLYYRKYKKFPNFIFSKTKSSLPFSGGVLTWLNNYFNSCWYFSKLQEFLFHCWTVSRLLWMELLRATPWVIEILIYIFIFNTYSLLTF